jgi:oligopeptide transport system substrate-binding protein
MSFDSQAHLDRLSTGFSRRELLAAGSALPLLSLPGVAQAQEPKVLHYGRLQPFDSLDPIRQFDYLTSELVLLTHATLLAYSYLERPFALEPDLLERLPELSADKLTLTLRLKKGVRFHDNACFPGGKGRELQADDVLFSIKRFADAKLNNKSWFAMEGAVVGLDAHRAATAKGAVDHRTAAVEGLKRIDSHTLSIKLTKPNPLFLFSLAISPTAPVSHEAVAMYGDQLGVNPVGTGPYTTAKAERKGVLRLAKHPHYHQTYPAKGAPGDREQGLLKDAGRKLPLIDVLEMPLIEEPQPGMLKFLKGELDWRGVDRANFTKMVRRKPDGGFELTPEFAGKFEIYAALSVSVTYLNLNLKDPLIGGNKLLRQALQHLVDTQGEIDTLNNGRGQKLKSLVPLELPGNERDTGASYPSYDVAKAKALLAQAGYPDGKGLPPLVFRVGGTTSTQRTGFDFHKARFAAAGVQLRPEFTDYPSAIKAVEAGNFQLADLGGWVADYPDAENLFQLLYSKNVAPGPNHSSFANAAYDRAYEASRHMANGPQRYALFKTMNELIRDEVPILLGYNAVRFGIRQKWLTNFKRNELVPEFKFLDIDMAAKKKGI